MSDIYNHYITKYIEGFTNLESHLLCLQDSYGILQDIENIDIDFYPYTVIPITNNVVFRALYEHIKHESDNNYILLFNGKENPNKLLDFSTRAQGSIVHPLSIQNLMQCFEETIKWNDRINEFNISDIKYKFKEIIYYGKSLRKNYIEKKDTDKIVLSSLLDLDATKIYDEVDCYLYYRDIRDLYGGAQIFQDKYKTNINDLMIKVFQEYSILMSDIIRHNVFEQFDKLLWVSSILYDYSKLSSNNLKIVLGEGYYKLIENYELYFEKLIELVNLIEKKDKKYFVEKKDWAEKIVLKTEIDILSDDNNYIEFLREKRGSYISIIKVIQELLENYNLEGFKKVFSTRISDLYDLLELIEENNYYKMHNITNIINLYKKIVKLVEDIEHIDRESKSINKINDYKQWQEFYKNHLYDLQYRLSEIRFLDKENLIEQKRYIKLDIRLSKILNRYRERFSRFLEENYPNWISQNYGLSRPILNSDIEHFINLNDGKNMILIFDGMRYDAWKYIVSPFFEETFRNKDVTFSSSFSLLPSITSISREAIYSKIVKEHRKDTTFLTKSESMQNQNEMKEILLKDKKNNIFVFNMFDKDGHKATEDFYIFYDKQRKVFENTITELIRLMPKDANIIIASDHGLMRIDEYLNTKDIEGILNVKSRYLKAQQNAILNNSIEITGIDGLEGEEKYLLSYSNTGYFIGGGERDLYSHGGASLEEVLVPFIIAKGKSTREILDTYNTRNKAVQKKEIQDKLLFEDGVSLNLGFKLNEKERLIIETLYNLKNQTITTQDIETKLVRVLGSAGMTNSLINRLIRKLKREGLDIIEVTSAGDVFLYKFKHSELKGAN